ncbi:MAG: hypothetical protein ACK5XN_26685 [Bacteroidota bacterium]|jgi:hypothetical protein
MEIKETITRTSFSAAELTLTLDGYRLNTLEYAPREHYKFIRSIGRGLPSTAAQARHFVAKPNMDVLNMDDVHAIEAIMNAAGLQGRYQYTKSGRWVRLVNSCDFAKAIKVKFGI